MHNRSVGIHDPRWPALPYESWKDTYATLHMWTQVVGKIALATAPPVNHSWAVAMQVTSRGLSTNILSYGGRAFTIEFDFVDHHLVIRTAEGVRSIELGPRTVADFYRDAMALLREMALPIKIWRMPVEIPAPIRFDEDVQHRSYDRDAANRFWRILVEIARVFTLARTRFVGKCSPVHFFWGSFDLAVTRFSGRRAPERPGADHMTREAYSHELSSCGFWPGTPGGPVAEPAYYAYMSPEPAGFAEAGVKPAAASYRRELGEFILPYEAVRSDTDPEAALLAFAQSAYEAGATLAGWDRAALER
jgi:Family of unknown function (DUF5996)